jgi:predicted amidophosphoribosyltransferase
VNVVRRFSRAALNLLLPPQCLTCDAEVESQGGFCPDCFVMAHLISDPCCTRCGAPFAYAAQAGPEGQCPRCAADPPPWGRARAALAYDAFSRRAILPLKHADRTDLATALAPMMLRAGRGLLADADLLVPVPLHRSRLFARRYNQSALLARAIGRLAGVAVMPDALCRVPATASLAGKDPAARAAEVAGAIAARPHRRAAIAGRRVVLVDDVLTSGATCRACTQALFAAGAAAVDVLVAARVPDPRLR